MHSNFDQEIRIQFQQAFNRISTSGVQDYWKLENEISHFLDLCEDGIAPIQLLQTKLVSIKRQLPSFDSVANHGYLYLAYEYAKKQYEDDSGVKTTGDFISSPRVPLIDKLQGKAKIMEKVEEKPVDILMESLKSIDMKEVVDSLQGQDLATITRKSRALAKSLAEESELKLATVRIAKKLVSVLNEVNLMPESDIGKKARFGLSGEVLGKKIDDVVEHGTSRIDKPDIVTDIGSIKGVNLKLLSNENKQDESHLISHDSNGDIHHYLKLQRPEGFHKDVIVSKLAIKNHDIDSPVKMHDIYNHLINNGMTMMSDSSQSHGGLAIWKKLASTPGISVHGWNTRTDEPVNTDEALHDISDTHKDEIDDIDNHPDWKENDDILRNVRLIAHKKDLTEETLNEIHLLNYEKSQKFEDEPFYGRSTINDAREYQGNFAKETDLGNIGPLNVSQFEEQTRSGPRGRIMTHDDEGRIHHVLTYEKPYGSSPETIKIKSITANDKHKVVGAHELYHHLLEKGNRIESGEDMTVGGLKVWNKLASMPGVMTHGWDGQKNLPIRPDKLLNPATDIPEHAVLVAHK